MYEKFTSFSLNEFYKIVKTMDSIMLQEIDTETFREYYKVIYNMTLVFANNLDCRDYKLKKSCVKNLNLYKGIKNWRRYRKFSNILMEELTKELENWVNNAKAFYEDPDYEEPRIQIKGFE